MKNRVIAIVGKGGVGKTIFTGLFLKSLIEMGQKKILMVDADPTMSHLTTILGLKTDKNIETIRKEVIGVAARKDEDEKQDFVQSIEYRVLEALIETKQFSLLAMGQPETKGCFCPANTLLREVIEKFCESFELMIIDCEAGLEQINRKVIRVVDTLIIVSDSSLRSLQTALAIKKTAYKFTQTKEMYLVINKVHGNIDRLLQYARDNDLSVIGQVPLDDAITDLDLRGASILEVTPDASSLIAVKEIVKKINLT
ncbi:MAG: AAA family ATPase [Candidatus Helarchaeota archaeon]